jgi:hypothetical protein
MPKYGEAAVAAVQMLTQGGAKDAPEAWNCAVKKFFPGRPASQLKGCPRGAFLGLCQEGLVEGVPTGTYTKSQLNKQYAVAALRILQRRPALVDDRAQLWHLAVGQKSKAHNSQMDVVIELFRQGLVGLVPHTRSREGGSAQ